MKKHFYIFRHGQSIWNAEGRPQGQHEYPVPLTILGEEQALSLASKLEDKKIKKILSSDLLRAKQTAEIIASHLGISIELDSRLREVDYGKLNGLYTIEREQVFPEFKHCYEDFTFPFPDGECLKDVALRFRASIHDAAVNIPHRVIGISSHGHAIVAFLKNEFSLNIFRLNNCDFVHISYDKEKDLFHLEEIPDSLQQSTSSFSSDF